MQRLEDLIKKNNIPPFLIFNFDETMLDPSKRRVKVISHAKRPRPFIETAQKGEHITFGLCITASGEYLKPLCILPLVNLPPLSSDVENFYSFSGQPNGFINKEIFHLWIREQFIPNVNKIRQQHNCPSQSALLLIDSHNSRDDAETIQLCTDNNILAFTFPAHSSHLLQPLDLGVNKSLKDQLRESFEPILHESTSDRRNRLLQTSIDCLIGALIPTTIKRGFRRAGIFPFCFDAPFKTSLVKLAPSTPSSSNATAKNVRRRIANSLLNANNTYHRNPLPAAPPTPEITPPTPPPTPTQQPVQQSQPIVFIRSL